MKKRTNVEYLLGEYFSQAAVLQHIVALALQKVRDPAFILFKYDYLPAEKHIAKYKEANKKS